MSSESPMLKAAPVTSVDEKIKLALWGNFDSGKTTFGVRLAEMFPKLKLFIALTEPMENLTRILDGYPAVKERAVYIPNPEQMEKIKRVGEVYDKQGYQSGQEIALAEFLHSELLKVCAQPRDEISKWIIMIDTASQIAKELVNKVYDRIHRLPVGDPMKISQKRARFAYGPAKRAFNVLAKRLFKLPTHVVMIGRTSPIGEVDKKKGGGVTFTWTRDERPEWDGSSAANPSRVWYEATTIIHLHKITRTLRGEDNSYVPMDEDLLPGKYHTETLRWAELKKHKTKVTVAPVFWNPSPWEIYAWIKSNSLALRKSS